MGLGEYERAETNFREALKRLDPSSAEYTLASAALNDAQAKVNNRHEK
jgi:hypothetical protein